MPREGHASAGVVGTRHIGLNSDAKISARKIRQPIESKGDIANAFDSITYYKGASVLRMYERWLGSDVFRTGLRGYFSAHADKTATAADFLAAISQAAGRDVAPAFSTFLDAPGAPELEVALACAGGPPRAHVRQRRYLPLRSQ